MTQAVEGLHGIADLDSPDFHQVMRFVTVEQDLAIDGPLRGKHALHGFWVGILWGAGKLVPSWIPLITEIIVSDFDRNRDLPN